MLVAARLRHIAATKWGTKRYLTAELLQTTRRPRSAASSLRPRLADLKVQKILDTTALPSRRRINRHDRLVRSPHQFRVSPFSCAGADATAVPVRPYGVPAPTREHLPPGRRAPGRRGGGRVIRWFMWLEELRASLQPRTRVPGLIGMLRASARQLDLDHGSLGCLSRAR